MSKISSPNSMTFLAYVKANAATLNFNFSAYRNAKDAIAKVKTPNAQLLAMVAVHESRLANAKKGYTEYFLNRITPGAGTIVVNNMTQEEKDNLIQANALFDLQFPLNVKIPNLFMIGKTQNSEPVARKANVFFATLKETIAPSTIEGISKGTLSLNWLCNALGIKKASEATQVLGLIGSTSRKAWIDGDNQNYLSLSVGKDSGSGMICFKWAIKD